MKLRLMAGGVILLVCFYLAGCGNDNTQKSSQKKQSGSKKSIVLEDQKDYAVLPDNIKWLTNESDPVFSSTKAQKGGILHTAVTSYP